MNNDLNISMKIVSSDNINMKLEDNKPIDVNMSGGIVEVDPIFRNSPAYTITYNDINIWNHKSNFSGNYNDLTNKPTIPTQVSQLVNDLGYINKNVTNLVNYTLTSNLSNVALTGDYSDLTNKPTIPTKTSELTNDSGFIDKNVNDLNYYTLSSNLSVVATTGDYTDLSNLPTLSTVATTGFYSDLINKPTLSAVASSGDYDDLTNKPTIPTKTSELTNDSGFITNANIPTKTSDLTNDSGFITMSDIPTIPTKTSDLTNDSGFITNTVNDLTNYTLSSALSSVATSGSYNDLSNKPSIPNIDVTEVNPSDYITISSSFTLASGSPKAYKSGNLVFFNYDITGGTINNGETQLGTCSNKLVTTVWGTGRCMEAYPSTNLCPASLIAIPSGAFRIYTTKAGSRSAGTIILLVNS